MSRISFVSTLDSVPWGGSELLWAQTAARLSTLGHEISANVQWWPQTPAPIEELQNAGCKFRFRRLCPRQKMLAKAFLKTDLATKQMEYWLKETAPELVFLSLECQTPGVEWMQACARLNIPFAFVMHSANEFLWPPDHVNAPYAEAVEKACGQFFVSQGNLDWARKQFARPLPNAQIVRNPFGVSYDAAPPCPQFKEQSTLRLACVGRLHAPSKGQDILLEVLRQDKWKARDLQVTFFGSGPNEQALRDLAALWKIANVSFGGHTGDVEAIWRDNHALVLPSRVEGLPIVIVEALLCARPCIVTDVAGNAELLEDNVTGFVAKAPTFELVDEALERAWQKRGDLQSMGIEGARRVRTEIPRDPAAVFAAQLLSLIPA